MHARDSCCSVLLQQPAAVGHCWSHPALPCFAQASEALQSQQPLPSAAPMRASLAQQQGAATPAEQPADEQPAVERPADMPAGRADGSGHVTLFFAKVPRSAPEADVRQLFASFGAIVELNLFTEYEVRCGLRCTRLCGVPCVHHSRPRQTTGCCGKCCTLARARSCAHAACALACALTRGRACAQGALASKGCGLVVMESSDAALAVINALDSKHKWPGMRSPMVGAVPPRRLQRVAACSTFCCIHQRAALPLHLPPGRQADDRRCTEEVPG